MITYFQTNVVLNEEIVLNSIRKKRGSMVLIDESHNQYDSTLLTFPAKAQKDIKLFLTMMKHVRLYLICIFV